MSQNNPIFYAGLDVAKESLALEFEGRAYSLTNDARGQTKLVRILGGHPNVHVVLEATGGYEQAAVRALHNASITLSVLEPARVRSFARAKGLRAKTDPIDAAVLRAFGEALAPRATTPPTAQHQQMGEWVTRRRQLTESATCEANRAAHYTDPMARRQAAALLRLLRFQIAQCEKAIARLIAKDEAIASRAARLQEVAGVGPVTAATLIAEMPELGHLCDESAAALAGVAPYNRDSGPYGGCRRIAGGRASVRSALYMAALSACRYDPILKTFHQRLISNGKKPRVALTAVMRKLIVLLNRLLKNPDFRLQAA